MTAKRIVLMAMVTAAVAAPNAHALSFAKVSETVLEHGSIRGIVVDGERHEGGSSNVAASFSGLTAGTHYAVVGSTAPCSEPATEATNAFTLDLRTAETPGTFSEGAGAGAASVSSSRLFALPEGGSPQQVACQRAIDNSVPDGPVRIVASVFRGGVKGVVAGTQKTKGAKTRLSVSLLGLVPGAKYAIVGSRRGCSHAATRSTNAYAFRFRSSDGTAFAQAARKTAATKSIRVFQLAAGGGSKQVACGVTVLDNEARLT